MFNTCYKEVSLLEGILKSLKTFKLTILRFFRKDITNFLVPGFSSKGLLLQESLDLFAVKASIL